MHTISVKTTLFVLLCMVFLVTGCAGINQHRPPVCKLDIPPAFNYCTAVKKYKQGDFIYNDPPYVKKADYPITKMSGNWGPRPTTNIQDTNHYWNVEVSLTSGSKILAAYSNAKTGYDANVDEESNYMFARFEKKVFPWGKGFSYFTQFTQDTSYYVPHNGHLTYEIWGVTNDLMHVVHATASVTHSKLGNWPDVRDAPTFEGLKNDPDYKLIESCKPGDFEPPLQDIDSLVGSLQVK